jgi:hypothetical protein
LYFPKLKRLIVTGDSYKLALKTAREELQEVLIQQVELSRRAVGLKKSIEVLAVLCNEDPKAGVETFELLEALSLETTGITDGIRLLLRQAMEKNIILDARNIRDLLAKRGFDLSQYANEMAVIHNTLRRLEKQGELEPRLTGWEITPKGIQQMAIFKGIAGLAKVIVPEKKK